MNEIPLLLAENGNYTSLADLTLRKIKALNSLRPEERLKRMSDSEYTQQIEECHGVILALFGAIDKSIVKDSGDLKFGNNQKEIDMFDYFYKKLSQIQNNELKLQLLHKILKRIEQFNDQLLLLTIYDYLLSRPADRFNVDLLPAISEEQQNRIFDQIVYSQEIQKEKFQSLVKLLVRRKDALRLSQLTLNVCTHKQLIIDLSP